MSLSAAWDTFLKTFEDGATVLAKNTVDDALDAAKADAKDFVKSSETKLKRWGDLLAKKDLDREEFEFLVGSQRDLARLHALKALGTSQARLERFRQGLISLAVSSAFRTIGL